MTNQFSMNIDRPLATVEVMGSPQDDIIANQYTVSANNENNPSGREIERLYQTIKNVANKLSQFHEKLVNEYKKGIVKLSIEIARKILTQKISERDYAIESIIEEALKNAPTRKDIAIHLNPEDFIKCQNLQQTDGQNIFTGIKLVSDPNIKPAECVIETPKGIVESFIEQHLDRIEKVFEKQGKYMLTSEQETSLIDFEKLNTMLHQINLMDCRGFVVRVSGLTVESNGPILGVGELCGINTRNGKRVLAEVVGFHKDHLILLPLDHIDGISPGDTVTARTAPRAMNLSDSVLGRVLNGLGETIDGKGPLTGKDKKTLDANSPPPLTREKISKPLSLGIRSIDGLLTCGKGQRVGIFAGSGVGKSVLLGDIANSSEADVNVVALIGERGREVREFLEENLGPEGLSRSAVIIATSDCPAIQRVKAAFVAATIAEYFRDKGKNVLFMMDSLTRFAQAQREIGLAAGEPPAAKGYCPSVFALMPRLIERLGCGEIGSITGILTVLVENDDLTDPVADSARSLLDGHFVLSRKLGERGHFPAVDILASVSRLMPVVTSKEHRKAAQKLREIYATYLDAEDLINIGALSPGSNKRIDGAIALIDRINRFLIQPVRERTSFEETVKQLLEITTSWEGLLGI